jgi:hypothetical protein
MIIWLGIVPCLMLAVDTGFRVFKVLTVPCFVSLLDIRLACVLILRESLNLEALFYSSLMSYWRPVGVVVRNSGQKNLCLSSMNVSVIFPYFSF